VRENVLECVVNDRTHPLVNKANSLGVDVHGLDFVMPSEDDRVTEPYLARAYHHDPHGRILEAVSSDRAARTCGGTNRLRERRAARRGPANRQVARVRSVAGGSWIPACCRLPRPAPERERQNADSTHGRRCGRGPRVRRGQPSLKRSVSERALAARGASQLDFGRNRRPRPVFAESQRGSMKGGLRLPLSGYGFEPLGTRQVRAAHIPQVFIQHTAWDVHS
jgi:hypothetical protein